MRKLLTSGGALLGLSAVISKIFGLWRDRLLVQTFGESGGTDLVFAAFRIPDFFFFFLVSGTVASLFLPRISEVQASDREAFFSSFLNLVLLGFGAFCLFGVWQADVLVSLFAAGFDFAQQLAVTELSRWLFGSVFLLALSSVFSAFHQYQHRFWTLALAPILYMASICVGIFLVGDQFGLMIIGWAAMIGAVLHVLLNAAAYFFLGHYWHFVWKKPVGAWNGFRADFWRRIASGAAFQINQTADVLIATFLAVGSVMAFSIGSVFGHVLMSIVGFPIAQAIFPKLTQAKNNFPAQTKLLTKSLLWGLLFSVPFMVFSFFAADFLLSLLFTLEGAALEMTKTVFVWTALSAPAYVAIPVLVRFFLANDDTDTPLWVSSISLGGATVLAAVLCFWVLPPEKAILGLALGNFVANWGSALLFGVKVYRQH